MYNVNFSYVNLYLQKQIHKNIKMSIYGRIFYAKLVMYDYFRTKTYLSMAAQLIVILALRLTMVNQDLP